ncbi:MAG: HAD family hydrolase, partial [Clostridium sp.]
MLKALVFDFDGVIVDTETQWYYIYRDWLKRMYHYDLSIQDYLVCVGSSSERLFAFLKQELGTDEEIRKFEKQAMTEFIQRTQNLPAMEGVRELVIASKAKGLQLAIATSATRKKPLVHLE